MQVFCYQFKAKLSGIASHQEVKLRKIESHMILLIFSIGIVSYCQFGLTEIDYLAKFSIGSISFTSLLTADCRIDQQII